MANIFSCPSNISSCPSIVSENLWTQLMQNCEELDLSDSSSSSIDQEPVTNRSSQIALTSSRSVSITSQVANKMLCGMNQLTNKNHQLNLDNIELMLRLLQTEGVSQANPSSMVRFSKKVTKNNPVVIAALAKFGHPEGLARTVILPPQEKPTHFGDLTWCAVATSHRIAKDKKPSGNYKQIRFAVDHTGSSVAIGVIRMSNKNKAIHLEETEREIEVMKQMNQAGATHVVQLKNCWLDPLNQKYYVVMEACNGGDLFDRLCLKGPLTLKEKLIVFKDIILGLKEMAEQGMAHYDLKSENVLLILNEQREIVGAKIADFGFAKPPTNWDGRGTPRYWSPEQKRCAKQASKQEAQQLWERFGGNQFPHDVFSTGMIGLNLFANDLERCFAMNPWTNDYEIVSENIRKDRIAQLEDSECPPEIKTVISEMLSESYTKRPTLDQIWERIENIC